MKFINLMIAALALCMGSGALAAEHKSVSEFPGQALTCQNRGPKAEINDGGRSAQSNGSEHGKTIR